ncbi:hypothetical protein pdam_00010273 [Pocillopora damicornis]|uniref:Anaphylatoxin-like domain-containing protein n=1 Tax=Pocillopora damicornis TaxID=46731 RepID=A0A3M6TMP0_POCDA|nr:hypothetical protein pdam_00010273 [Pocillopora damicornis]
MTNVLTVALRFSIFLLIIGCTEAKRFAIIAPNVFHVGVEENVSVAVYDAMQPVTVKLYLQDYPFRRKTFSPNQVTLQPGKGSTSLLTVKVEPGNLPDIKSVDMRYVYLIAKSDDGHFQFHKEVKILLSFKNGMVFIQTDKPIYTPKQKDNFDGRGIISKELLLSNFIILGNWTVTATYGHQNIYNTSVQFEVKEYGFFDDVSVLPKFSVKLQVPPYILKTDKDVEVQLKASYTYGKPVVGSANVYLSIALKGKVIPIATQLVLLDEKGTATVEERVNFIKNVAGEIWFPEGGRLHVQADVTERATGEKETAVDKSCKFTSNPYLVEIIDTPKYFKPGMPFTVKVVVSLNEKPTESISVRLSATGKSLKEEKRLTTLEDKTIENGEAEFTVDACTDCQTIKIEVEAVKENIQPALANFVLQRFDAENGPLIVIRHPPSGKLKVDGKSNIETYRKNDDKAAVFSYVVEFTYEGKRGGETQNKVETQPAKNYVIKLKAPKGTRLGILGVDKSVYLLRNENRLNKERVLKAAKELDLGCGVGGGKNNRDIFKRAGVVIMTDNFVSDGRNGYGCDEDGSRRKRRSSADPVMKMCCEWGRKAGGNVTCAKLSLDANKNLPDDCREAFWTCCVETYGRNDSALLGRSGAPSVDDDERYLAEAKVYLRGNKDFCSTADDDSLVLIGILYPQPNDARSVAVPIIPKTAGKIEIEVTSILEIKEGNKDFWEKREVDAVKRELLVVPEGKENRTSRSFTLDPKGILNDDSNNGGHSSTTSPRNISIDFAIPPKAISGSTGAVVYLTGNPDEKSYRLQIFSNLDEFQANFYLLRNLLGPVINTTIEGGLEKFFRQPTGCGEQTMLFLAPNVYVLEYLMNTKQISGASAESAHRFIQSGYQRELNYRRDDRSFSAFGNERPGSTWLTAFVMKVFCKAKKFLGDEIEEKMLCESVGWLIENQRNDGAFPEVHHVIHREMVGGVYNSEGDVAMTAFVLSALLECNCKAVSQAHLLRATNFLESRYKNLNRPYSMALTAYALSLVDSREKVDANDRLLQRSQYDDVKKTRHWNTGGNALNVETAGYALMTQVLLGRTVYAGPIVTYITGQRQGGVGFVSTQDTVVALQALALHSEKTTGNNNLDLRVKVETEKGDVKEFHHINPENALLRREVKIPEQALPGKLFVETKGSGVGLLEVETRYNLPSSRDEICMFELSIKVVEIKGDEKENLLGPMQSDAAERERQEEEEKRNNNKNKQGGNGRKKGRGCKKIRNREKKKQCKRRGNNKGNPKKGKKPQSPPKYQPVKNIRLEVCTRYKKPDGKSKADREAYNAQSRLVRQWKTDLPQLDMIEESDRSLVLYLSEIPSDHELCVNVLFEKEFYVGAVQSVPVNVYDYYQPDKCPQDDPPIDNINKLKNIACTNYQYIIKGKLLLVDEVETMLEYVVEVVQIILKGNKKLKLRRKDGKKTRIEFTKRGTCRSLKLETNKEYLIMGRDEGGKYELDENSFVKLWPEVGENKAKLDKFAREFKPSKC